MNLYKSCGVPVWMSVAILENLFEFNASFKSSILSDLAQFSNTWDVEPIETPFTKFKAGFQMKPCFKDFILTPHTWVIYMIYDCLVFIKINILYHMCSIYHIVITANMIKITKRRLFFQFLSQHAPYLRLFHIFCKLSPETLLYTGFYS